MVTVFADPQAGQVQHGAKIAGAQGVPGGARGSQFQGYRLSAQVLDQLQSFAQTDDRQRDRRFKLLDNQRIFLIDCDQPDDNG